MSDVQTTGPKTTSKRAKQSTVVRAADDAPPTPVELLQWKDVSIADLRPYAPDPSIPMAAYAVTTVMLWAQAQGYAGAIPTWEVGDGTWGVVIILKHPAVSTIEIAISELQQPFVSTDVPAYGQAVARWGAAHGYALTIPTFQSDGTNVTAVGFSTGYPGLSSYDASNVELFQSFSMARRLADLHDAAIWAQAVMRVGMANGFAAAWPSWEWTTSRGLIGMSQYDYGALPAATDDNVQNVLTILDKTVNTLQISTADALATFAGVYTTFNEAPIEDPGLEILTDCIFGALQIAANLIPGVGGAIGALISTAVTVAQAAAKASAGSGTTTLQTYQSMLTAATNATIDYVSTVHDTLLDSQQNGNLQAVWEAPYKNPLGGLTMQLGMLADASNDVVNGDLYWTSMAAQITSQLNLNLEVQITAQLYKTVRRTYPNAPMTKQWWYGTVASVTAPDGDCAKYIASSADELSVWFTDFTLEPGHARGSYVTTTEFWLQAAGDGIPAYPPSDLCYALFSSDGFGNTQSYTGAFEKSTVYDNWLMSTDEVGVGDGDDGGGVQQWRYATTGNIVSVTIVDYGAGTTTLVGTTDAYGNLTLNANSDFGFQQQLIVNYLGRIG